ncbi:MAG: DUF3368 domain-containing protein [Acidobacteria bacterium]|nr:MAG: DUF3368 domain-containing protein [Acidobacteriota bacterium]
MSLWVIDASPLIFLAKLDRLGLLREGAGEILVPPAVWSEVRQLEDEALDRLRHARRSWLQIKKVANPEALAFLRVNLHAGEAEAIALAKEIRAERIVEDDLAARRYARRLGLSIVGTLGLILAARIRGEIPSVAEEIGRLRAVGFRISEQLETAVLRAAGEIAG